MQQTKQMMKHVFGHRSGKGTYDAVDWGAGEAEVYGSPTIINSSVLRGKVFDTVTILNSEVCGPRDDLDFEEPTISGKSIVVNSKIFDGVVLADEAIVNNSLLYGASKVIENGNIRWCNMHDNAIVAGDAVVSGTEYSPVFLRHDVYIDRGFWNRAPLSFSCKSGYVVTESVDNLVNVSCTTNTIDKWLSGAGRRYGRILNMAEKEIDEIQGYVEMIRDFKIAALKAGELAIR